MKSDLKARPAVAGRSLPGGRLQTCRVCEMALYQHTDTLHSFALRPACAASLVGPDLSPDPHPQHGPRGGRSASLGGLRGEEDLEGGVAGAGGYDQAV